MHFRAITLINQITQTTTNVRLMVGSIRRVEVLCGSAKSDFLAYKTRHNNSVEWHAIWKSKSFELSFISHTHQPKQDIERCGWRRHYLMRIYALSGSQLWCKIANRIFMRNYSMCGGALDGLSREEELMKTICKRKLVVRLVLERCLSGCLLRCLCSPTTNKWSGLNRH